jgi:hypothetical protein
LNAIKNSKAIEELDAHLSERMAILTENNLEVNQLQRESLDNLVQRIEKLETNHTKHHEKLKTIKQETGERIESEDKLFEELTLSIKENDATIFNDLRKTEERLIAEISTIKHKTPEEKESERLEREAVQLSKGDRRRIDELTDFYRHMNQVVENVIEKFSQQERIVT